MPEIRVVSFNVNQFSPVAHEQTDIRNRMTSSDVVLCQETVKVDLVTFAQSTPDWRAFQIRHGDNDGHANTAVLSRISLAGGQRVTDEVLLGDEKGMRRRFLAAEQLQGVWFASAHINPKRFSAGIREQLANLGAWVHAHPGPVVIGLDKNQCKPADLEKATGLKWHGIDIDGFLTNLPLKALAEFPKGFSDHPGVHAIVTVPDTSTPEVKPVKKKSRLEQIIAALREALAHFRTTGKKARARRAHKALKELKGKPQPKPQPTPPPAPEPVVPESNAAVAHCRNQSHNGPQFGVNQCRLQCRIALGKPSVGDFDGDGDADAEDAWKAAKLKHPGDRKPPRGKGVFWGGGSHDNGHEAISAGPFNGVWHIWSTDIVRPGFFDFVPLSLVEEKWGLTYLGWAEDQ